MTYPKVSTDYSLIEQIQNVKLRVPVLHFLILVVTYQFSNQNVKNKAHKFVEKCYLEKI